MQANLRVLRGAKPTTIAIRLPTVIGRSGASQVKLPASTVSRQHCELYAFEDQLVVRDLGSANGTIVNGHQIQGPTYLTPEDELTVGPVTMCSMLLPDVAGSAAAGDQPSASERGPSGESSETGLSSATRPAESLQQASATDVPCGDGDEDSVVDYSEDASGGFLGILPTDGSPSHSVEQPSIETEDRRQRAVDSNENELHKFFDSLDQ